MDRWGLDTEAKKQEGKETREAGGNWERPGLRRSRERAAQATRSLELEDGCDFFLRAKKTSFLPCLSTAIDGRLRQILLSGTDTSWTSQPGQGKNGPPHGRTEIVQLRLESGRLFVKSLGSQWHDGGAPEKRQQAGSTARPTAREPKTTRRQEERS